jgi:hypothetical protein
MHWQKRFVALLVMLMLVGCAQRATGEAGPLYAPYSPQTNGNVPERGGGDGSSGGSGM